MITCDIFELEIWLETKKSRQKILYKYWTDLPSGTLVGVICSRIYQDHNDNDCLWTLYEDELVVAPKEVGDFSGGHGVIDVIDGDKLALEEFNDTIDQFSAGIKNPVGDEISFELSVGARQKLKAFGKNNCNLAGAEVFERGGVNVVEVEKKIVVPILDEFQPLTI